MSAIEVIELIKKLPPEEQAVVFAFGDEAREQAAGGVVRQANRDKAREVARQVFDRHPELFRKLAQ
ncbi:MAG: hypothetical protein RIQ79_2065 [Verrucomicrobiota bacterium]|jgi:hypothetical protein